MLAVIFRLGPGKGADTHIAGYSFSLRKLNFAHLNCLNHAYSLHCSALDVVVLHFGGSFHEIINITSIGLGYKNLSQQQWKWRSAVPSFGKRTSLGTRSAKNTPRYGRLTSEVVQDVKLHQQYVYYGHIGIYIYIYSPLVAKLLWYLLRWFEAGVILFPRMTLNALFGEKKRFKGESDATPTTNGQVGQVNGFFTIHWLLGFGFPHFLGQILLGLIQ